MDLSEAGGDAHTPHRGSWSRRPSRLDRSLPGVAALDRRPGAFRSDNTERRYRELVPHRPMVPRDEPLHPLGRALWWAGPAVVRTAGRIGFSLRSERLAEIPRPPFVVAANHFSHFDPPAVGAVLGTAIRYLALDELADANRFLASVLPAFGTIPLSRSRVPIAALRVALGRLAAGEVVGVFPEGLRVARWGDHPPKRGAAWLAIRAGVPLVPVAVIGTDRAMGLDNRLHRAAITVVVGPALSPGGEDPSTLTDRWARWIDEQIRSRPDA